MAKNIEIRTSVVGADQAAREIEKVEKSVEDLGESQQAADVSAIRYAQGLDNLGRTLGTVGQGFGDVSRQIKADAPELADKLSDIGQGFDMASSAASGAAQGLALGGPFGAAVGALIGVAMVPLRAELEELVKVWAELEASENLQAELAERHAEMIRLGADAYTDAVEESAAYDGKVRDLTASLKLLEEQALRTAKVTAAKDRADAAARDLADFEAIEGGADPDVVRQQRVIDDAKLAKQRANEEAIAARQRAERANELERTTAGDLEAKQNDPSLIGDERTKVIADLEKKAAAAAAAADKALADAKLAQELAGQKVREIEARAEREVRGLGNRIGERQRRAEDERLRGLDQQTLAGEETRQQGRAGAAAGAFGAAADRLPEDRKALAGTLRGIGKDLSDGTNEQELERIRAEFIAATEGLGGKTIEVLGDIVSRLAAQEQVLATMREQIKNNRPRK